MKKAMVMMRGCGNEGRRGETEEEPRITRITRMSAQGGSVRQKMKDGADEGNVYPQM